MKNLIRLAYIKLIRKKEMTTKLVLILMLIGVVLVSVFSYFMLLQDTLYALVNDDANNRTVTVFTRRLFSDFELTEQDFACEEITKADSFYFGFYSNSDADNLTINGMEYSVSMSFSVSIYDKAEGENIIVNKGRMPQSEKEFIADDTLLASWGIKNAEEYLGKTFTIKRKNMDGTEVCLIDGTLCGVVRSDNETFYASVDDMDNLEKNLFVLKGMILELKSAKTKDIMLARFLEKFPDYSFSSANEDNLDTIREINKHKTVFGIILGVTAAIVFIGVTALLIHIIFDDVFHNNCYNSILLTSGVTKKSFIASGTIFSLLITLISTIPTAIISGIVVSVIPKLVSNLLYIEMSFTVWKLVLVFIGVMAFLGSIILLTTFLTCRKCYKMQIGEVVKGVKV